MRIPSFFMAILLLLAGSTSYAQRMNSSGDVPRTISYQGLLTSPDGTLFTDGRYNITVTLYADENGTHQVWQETYKTEVTGGLFNLNLGNVGAPLPSSTALNTPLWIGTSVDGAEEMRPLTPLSASPYALNVPDRAITADKVDMDYISELRIDGEKVSGRGTVLNLLSTPGVPLSYDATTQSISIGRAAAGTAENPDEKGPQVMGAPSDSWAMEGDGVTPAGLPVLANANDWIGTSNAIDFIIKVNGQQTMQYQQTGAFAIPNIIGGQGNLVTAATSVASIIAGGNGSSITSGNYDVISGGQGNVLDQSHYSAIGGGNSNNTNNGDYNATGGGATNTISYGYYDVIGGGEVNAIENVNHSAIGGGMFNLMRYGEYNTIGGGIDNVIWNPAGYAINAVTISGGSDNQAEIDYATIGGGLNNNIVATSTGTTEYSTISGGSNNLVDGTSEHAAIGGGRSNQVVNGAPFGTIAGGEGNQMNREYGTIAGGQDNFLDDTSPYATISGGSTNVVGMGGDHSSVGGGSGNVVHGPYGTISGGMGNSTDINSMAPVIGGGALNSITNNGRYATIGGGSDNSIEETYGTIAGGRNNSIDNTSNTGTIAGGRDNVVSNGGNFATIGGGEANSVQGTHTTIPGGDQLATNASYAQVAVGFYNAPRGSMITRPSAATIAASNDPLFMVGNGNIPGTTRSNAFEVSYNGHTVVTGQLGNGAAPAITGATYRDNVVYGWGEVSAAGGLISEFGIGTVGHVLGTGVYTISLNVVDVNGLPINLTDVAVTATLNQNTCAFINVVRNATPPNTFTVNIRNASCLATDLPFSFHVTGR